ncbi:Uncharacterized conserved protein, cupin superfamily [Roseivivax lentus]|uniref:Uncharacterized conserved protein, cupin superfamily n=1 Tax=Roseivivax lentus TaxID=633194 RepID=A0A1N7KUK9_9RHOB|nr:cupin domain-containing protein [Roseivivax lentus]SIS65231.1 Uncharacterized conserved protein, cupin superfamily [Roseivivax lentus]
MPLSGTVSHLSAAAIRSMEEGRIRHPLNPASDVFLKRLAPVFGLQRLALYIARIPPGQESFLYHRHERDEEFLVILSGRGLAQIGEDEIEVGPGDIMAFPAPHGPPHHLTNPFRDDLVYLMGGESSGFDIAHYPRIGKQLVFSRSEIRLVDVKSSPELSFDDWQRPMPEEDEGL